LTGRKVATHQSSRVPINVNDPSAQPHYPKNPSLSPSLGPIHLPCTDHKEARSERGGKKAGRKGRGEEGKRRRKDINVRFFINPDPPVKASPAARIEFTLGMYIFLCYLIGCC
jgi:hypothetical protein